MQTRQGGLRDRARPPPAARTGSHGRVLVAGRERVRPPWPPEREAAGRAAREAGAGTGEVVGPAAGVAAGRAKPPARSWRGGGVERGHCTAAARGRGGAPRPARTGARSRTTAEGVNGGRTFARVKNSRGHAELRRAASEPPQALSEFVSCTSTTRSSVADASKRWCCAQGGGEAPGLEERDSSIARRLAATFFWMIGEDDE
ncbi:hypothetical protein C2845_PM12G19590 [Panicum miliaceum]|uniref:Uncharacterized protein n=1 Tax=Panicum miliaceum TaxID=4540 RepID=A0A3L6QBX7_PANMI|nr:hypothetical protein C2845_PM12G19590 [Panicum miliaceum]